MESTKKRKKAVKNDTLSYDPVMWATWQVPEWEKERPLVDTSKKALEKV